MFELKKHFIQWCIAKEYIVVEPKAATIEEAEESFQSVMVTLEEVIKLSSFVKRMTMKIRIATKDNNEVEAFKLRQQLCKRVVHAKSKGLL